MHKILVKHLQNWISIFALAHVMLVYLDVYFLPIRIVYLTEYINSVEVGIRISRSFSKCKTHAPSMWIHLVLLVGEPTPNLNYQMLTRFVFFLSQGIWPMSTSLHAWQLVESFLESRTWQGDKYHSAGCGEKYYRF